MAKIDDSVKKKVPELRFKGFTDPWVQRNLSDLATFSKGKGYSKSDLVSDGFPAILYGRMYTNYESQIDDISDTFVADATDAVLSQTGDVIVPGSGETPEDIARASNVNVSGIVLGGDINIIRPDTEKMDSTFLALTISNVQQQTELIKRAQGKSVVHLHNSDLKKVNVVAPSKDEQSAISSLFTQLDNLIAANQRKLDLLKEQKKGYLQKMFPKNGSKFPQLRFAGFADAWEQRKLGELGSTFTGLTGKTKEDFGHGDAKFVTYMNVFQNAVASLEQLDSVEIDPKQNEVKKGDVFFTTSSETPEEVGMSSVWKYNYDNVYLNSFTFGYRPNIEFDLDYLAAMLRSTTVRKKITFLAQGISRYNISKTKMMDIEVPVPSLEEQAKIGAFLSNVEQTITLHQRKLDLLKEQKKGFLQNMFV